MLIDDLDTPAVVIDLDRMETNISSMQAVANSGDVALRPHTKTHKIPALALKQIAEGAVGITVAKVGEAEVMADAGVSDILVAYPVVGSSKIERLLDVAERVHITVALDSSEVLSPLVSAATKRGVSIDILIEADTGFHRCGQPVGQKLMDLCGLAQQSPGANYRGIMTFLGHISGSRDERASQMVGEAERMDAMLSLLAQNDLSPDVVSVGSTPNAELIPSLPSVTEMRPGTYIFNDRNTVGTEACSYSECAMTVLATVVSTASGGVVTDSGSKTISSDRWLSGDGGCGFVPDDPGLQFVSTSEEHGHFDPSNANRTYKVGDRMRVIPNHTCVVTNLHDVLYGVRGETVEEMWVVAARGKLR
ncbi:MAG: alanine racemase [Candidatus Latescibacteria bacterium]|jgi:D-serine deaminase-like pyridoxal phosphate-dependent protein|nr:alanine racemase [Candidatus Latescibacterota bacterium]